MINQLIQPLNKKKIKELLKNKLFQMQLLKYWEEIRKH